MPGRWTKQRPLPAKGPCSSVACLLGDQRVAGARRSRDFVIVSCRPAGTRSAPSVVAASGLVFPEMVSGGVAELTLLAAALAPAEAHGPARGINYPVVLASNGGGFRLRLAGFLFDY